MSEDKETSSIKVIDKRRFTEGGEVNESAPEREPRFEEVKFEREPAAKEPPRPEAENSPPEEDGYSSEGAVTLNFSSFVMGLAHQTVMMLGITPDGQLDEASINLEGARQTIDALAMLQEKTQGNLTRDEEKLITESLAGLRMAYVERVKS